MGVQKPITKIKLKPKLLLKPTLFGTLDTIHHNGIYEYGFPFKITKDAILTR